jgi:ADP-ribose pyrophosphatase YjhB (NUDIX family)
MKRCYPDQPIIGVGAIVFKRDEVLLVRRGKEPALGEWSLPGGAVEVGETLEEALHRELREEPALKWRFWG